jgi:hypothetical protein
MSGVSGAAGKIIRIAIDFLKKVRKRAEAAVEHAAEKGLFSRTGKLTNKEVLEHGVGLPRTAETVEKYAKLAEVDFKGAKVDIVHDAETIRYLDFQGAVARTDHLGVQLGPAAFQDEETLVRTLGHESVHVEQYAAGRVSSLTQALEDEAYGAEQRFVDAWRRNAP